METLSPRLKEFFVASASHFYTSSNSNICSAANSRVIGIIKAIVPDNGVKEHKE